MRAPETEQRLRVVGFRYHPAIGGAEALARRLIREFGSLMPVDVATVVTDNRAAWLRLLVEGVRETDDFYEVDGRKVRALARWPPPVRRRLRRLAPFYHLPLSPAPSLMARILAEPLAPVVRGAAVIHNIFMGREAFSLGLMQAAQRAGIPFVFTPLRHERPLGWNSPAFRELYRKADALIALSRSEATWLAANGARSDSLSVIGAGPLNDPHATPDAARRVLGDGRIVLFLGQLHEYKGFRVLLEVARMLRPRSDVRFVFAGPDVRGHAALFRDAGPNVTYLPSVDDAFRDSLLQACTVLCVPSARESFGLVVVEAWNAGKPVIGGPASATRELIEDGIDGWSVTQDPRILASKLMPLIDEPNLAQQLGSNGKLKVDRQFSWPVISEAHLAVYSRVVSGRHSS